MLRADVIKLISESKTVHGVHDAPTKTERLVYCDVGSVSRTEFYNAHNANYQPEYVFKLALDAEYQGEKQCKFHDKLYEIIRTYMTRDGGIELTVQRSAE